ncbi:MAG: hypothetical protein LC789_04390 [Actinobacteria bacterium]|nr:hypothetical protein [Actinomycetota bacterium]
MYVRDIEGWNTLLDAGREINAIAAALGQPQAQLWTESWGPFNHVVAEIEHESLAAYETSQKVMRGNEDMRKQLTRIHEVSLEDRGYTEMMELATGV